MTGSIPASTLAWLSKIPPQRPVAMLVRHGARGPLTGGPEEYFLPLTPAGDQAALALGQHLGDRLRGVHTSPLTRTLQTAQRLVEGAKLPQPPQPDTMLGDPGVFVIDDRAGDTWAELGHGEVVRHFVEEGVPLPGCADPKAAARKMVCHLLTTAAGRPGVHAFVTHDSLVTATAARTLGLRLTEADWPGFLEAMFCWQEDDGVHIGYRSWHRVHTTGVGRCDE